MLIDDAHLQQVPRSGKPHGAAHLDLRLAALCADNEREGNGVIILIRGGPLAALAFATRYLKELALPLFSFYAFPLASLLSLSRLYICMPLVFACALLSDTLIVRPSCPFHWTFRSTIDYTLYSLALMHSPCHGFHSRPPGP